MGLLDIFDTEQGRLGLAMLAAAGPQARPMGFGERMMGALSTVDQMRQRQRAQQLQDEERAYRQAVRDRQQTEWSRADEQYNRDREIAALAPQFLKPGTPALSPLMGSGLTGQDDGVAPSAGRAATPASFDMQGYVSALMSKDPARAIPMWQEMNKPRAPINVAPGSTLVDPSTFKPVFSAPDKPAEQPSAVREYQFAVSQGYPGTFQQFQIEQKKAGANNTSVNVNTEKSFLNSMAGDLGKEVVNARGQAQAAASTVRTANSLLETLDSGKVMAGPVTPVGRYMLQLGEVFGVTGKDSQERLANTRKAMQSLAQLELDAAQQMKGQGQITESERAILRKAASGDVDNMTTTELRTLAGSLDKIGRAKIQSFQQQAKPLLNNPNAAPLAPFLSVDMPPAYTPPSVMRQPQQNTQGPRFLGFE